MNASDRAVLGTPLLGRSLGADGAPLDGGRPVLGALRRLAGDVPAPRDRSAIRAPLWTGIRAIDGPLAFGRGARIGIFGPPGTGKSTLLEALVAGNGADVTVVALIGERGREAESWLRRCDERTTIVCATSDRAASERVRAAELAFAQASDLAWRGLHVLLVVDSLARYAAAARDVAVAAGEPLGRGGVPPSVVGRQARLLERAGAFSAGSVSVVATVLSERAGDDPVVEAARAALDGHIVLAPRLAAAGHFPAIDIPASVSRTFAAIASAEHRRGAAALRAAMALLDESRDARALGVPIADPATLRAVAAEGDLLAFLRQGDAPTDHPETLMLLAALADRLE